MRIAIDARTLNAPKTGDRTVTLGLLKGLAQRAEHEGLRIFVVAQEPPPASLLPASAALNTIIVPRPRGYRWMLSAFPRACQQCAADVALLQYMGPFRLPCPFVTFIHDVVWRTMPETFPLWDRLVLNVFIPRTIRQAAAIVTGSAFAAQEIRRHYPQADTKLHVIPYAADEQFAPVSDAAVLERVRQRYALPPAYVLSVGVWQPRKNLLGLLHAYGKLPQTLREAYPLVIAGKPGWKMKALQMAIRVQEPYVRVIGYVSDEDLPALYSLATCFVYPSFYEGFGLPPLEAMACGTPVIASNVASLPEVCGAAALLVDPYSPEDIADALRNVLTDKSLRASLRERGMAQAASFSWKEAARELLQLLRQIVY